MNKLSLAVAAVLCAVSVQAETHLFILAGQSNMSRMNETKGFLPEIRQLLPGDEILVIKAAWSGKPIRNWLEEWDALAEARGLDPAAIRKADKVKGSPYYGKTVDRVQPLLEEKPDSITLVWMQGESDSSNGAEMVYEAALAQLIAKLRDALQAPEMNVVIGRISDFGLKNPKGDAWPGWDAIRKAQVKVAEADPRADWVDTDPCNDPANGLHHPPAGYKLQGELFARKAAELIAQPE